MTDEKPLTEAEVLAQTREIFPKIEWDLDDSLLGKRFVLKTKDIPYFNSLRLTVSFGHHRHPGSFQRDESKPRQNSAFSSYSLKRGGTRNLCEHTGRTCVRDAMLELKQHLFDELDKKSEQLKNTRQFLAARSSGAGMLSQCSRCEGEGRIELFSSVENPCTKCGGSGMQQNGKIKMGAGCYNPSALSRLKIQTEDTE